MLKDVNWTSKISIFQLLKWWTKLKTKTCLKTIFRDNLNELLSANPSQMNKDKIQAFLQRRMVTPCKDIKPFGGSYYSNCKGYDGHKYVCVEKLLEDVKNKRVRDW